MDLLQQSGKKFTHSSSNTFACRKRFTSPYTWKFLKSLTPPQRLPHTNKLTLFQRATVLNVAAYVLWFPNAAFFSRGMEVACIGQSCLHCSPAKEQPPRLDVAPSLRP